MNVLLMGDVHGYFDTLGFDIMQNQKQKDNYYDLIIQLGDFGWWPRMPDNRQKYDKMVRKLDVPIWFIDGNHEDHPDLIRITKEAEDKNNPIMVNKNVYYCRRGLVQKLNINGKDYNCLFIGGAASIDKNVRREGWSWFPEEIISQREIYDLPDVDIDIVFAHTCASSFLPAIAHSLPLPLSEMYPDPCQEALEYVINKYKPKFYFFGHWHFALQGYHEDTDTRWCVLNMLLGHQKDGPSAIDLQEYMAERLKEFPIKE